MAVVIETGFCKCTDDPMGDNGLEGFTADEVYTFEKVDRDKHGKPYFRVYHNPEYYETCGPTTFKSYFKPIEDE